MEILEIPINTRINIHENKVETYIVDRDKLDIEIIKGNYVLPENTEFISVEAIGIINCTDMIGGRYIMGYDYSNQQEGATTGFAVVDNYGNRGITTAGHFAYDTQWPLGYYQSTLEVIGVYRQISSPLDVAWYVDVTQTAVVTNQIQDSSNTTRSIYSVRDYSDIMEGDWVFKYGQTTGISFGEVLDLDFNGQFVRMINPVDDSYICDFGDSGAPCYIYNEAIGILQGQAVIQPYDNAVFSAVSFLSNWGINVLTVP